jgi:hypothetical protein
MGVGLTNNFHKNKSNQKYYIGPGNFEEVLNANAFS